MALIHFVSFNSPCPLHLWEHTWVKWQQPLWSNQRVHAVKSSSLVLLLQKAWYFMVEETRHIILLLCRPLRSPCTHAGLQQTWWWSTASRQEPPSSSALVATVSSRTQSSSPSPRGLCTCWSQHSVTSQEAVSVQMLVLPFCFLVNLPAYRRWKPSFMFFFLIFQKSGFFFYLFLSQASRSRSHYHFISHVHTLYLLFSRECPPPFSWCHHRPLPFSILAFSLSNREQGSPCERCFRYQRAAAKPIEETLLVFWMIGWNVAENQQLGKVI